MNNTKPNELRFRSGLRVADPAGMLRAKFMQWPWENYDGDRPADLNHLTLADVKRANAGLAARSSYDGWRQLIDAKGAQIDGLLAKFPETPLEDVDLDVVREPLIGLFNLVRVKNISISRATKVLFPFRPALLGVLDSVVENYYWYGTSITDEPRFRRLERAATWGVYAFELLALLREDVDAARDVIDAIRTAVAPEPYSKASRVRVVESLIWWYYQRQGALSRDEDE